MIMMMSWRPLRSETCAVCAEGGLCGRMCNVKMWDGVLCVLWGSVLCGKMCNMGWRAGECAM